MCRCDDEVGLLDERSTRKIFCKPGDEETHPIKTSTVFMLDTQSINAGGHTMEQNYGNTQEEHKSRKRCWCCEVSIMNCSQGAFPIEN
jgi:hypothetical protein